MKKLMKVVAMALTVVMAVGGCASKASTGGAAPAAPAETKASDAKPADTKPADTKPAEASGVQYPADSEKVTLRFSWWGSDTRHEAMETVADLYMEKHPNVTIEPEYGAWDGWQQLVLTQISGNTEPDVLQVNYNWVHSFGRGKNIFYDLNALKDFIDLSNWDQEQIDCMTVGGELAAVPHGVTARANLYNTALFAENNLTYPATYDDLIKAGTIIGKDNTAMGGDNKYVLTNIGKFSTDLFIAQMLYNKTGKVMQENGKVSYTEAEVKEIFDIYKSFEENGAMPTFKQDDPIQNESNPVWTSGRSGSVYEWVGTMDKFLGSYKNGEAKDEIKVAPYMTAAAGDKIKVFVKPSLGFAVSKNTKNPAVAADFINFMFTDEAAIRALGTQLGVSSNKATRAIQESDGMVKGAMKEGFDLLATYDQVVMDPYFEDENVRGQRYIAIDLLRSGEADSAAAAKVYIEKQQAELDKLFK